MEHGITHNDLISELWSDDSFWGYAAQIWLSKMPLVSSITGKMKKGIKGHEGQTKARESRIPKFYDFSISTGSFGADYWQIWMFLSFKAIKAKKAAVVARKTKL